MIRPHHSLAIIRLRPDIHERALGMLAEGQADGDTVQTALGEVRVGSAIRYQMTGKRDQFAFAEVVSLGEGEPVGSGMDRPEVKRGDIVGLDLGQAGHELPDHTVSCLWKNLICRFVPGQDLPEPLSSWVLTKQDPITMQRFVVPGTPSIHLPGQAQGSISSTKGKAKSGVRLTASPILAVGKGSFVKKAFVEPQCMVGEAAVFGSTCPVHLAWTEGRILQFVRWDDVEFSLGEDDAA